MTFLSVPHHEPEVIAAGARRFKGDANKVATTSRAAVTLHGVTITSRYGKAAEMNAMLQAVAMLELPILDSLASLYCDSKCGAYRIRLAEGIPGWAASRIADRVSMVLITQAEGHNGILVEDSAGKAIGDVLPTWPFPRSALSDGPPEISSRKGI